MDSKNILKLLFTGFLSLSCIFFQPHNAQAKNIDQKKIVVNMIPVENQTASGTITFEQKGKYVVINGKLSGLKSGKHGFHIHEHGDCDDANHSFKNALGHFNPTNVKHGSIYNGHIGDLGNIVADSKGNANFTLTIKKFNLKEDDKFSILHRAVMVHADPDDLKSDPAGNSGIRILCGVIE